MNAYTSIPMLVCLMFVTWSSYGKRPVSSVNFSGEEMFRGLFFVEGKYAEAIPELKSLGISYMQNEMTDKEKVSLSEIRNEVVSLIKAEDVTFFDDFKGVMLTENPMLIKAELAKTHDIINAKIQEILKISKGDFEKLESDFKESVKKNNNKIDKKYLEKLTKGIPEKEAALCPILIFILPICIVLICMVVIYVVIEEAVATNKSPLLLEQIVASVCNVSNQINA
jgi:SdpC family antimicrobial peptide